MEDGIVSRPYQQSTVAVLVVVTLTTIVMNVVFRRRRADANHNRALVFKDTVRGSLSILSNENSILDREGVKGSIEGYERLFDGARQSVGCISSKESVALREKEYRTMVNSFYDLVTDFYEWGWGQSFHFAPRLKGETFLESIKRAEYFLAAKMGISKHSKVLDVGCGVGGPLRNICQFVGGCDITGVTINDYQVKVGNQYCQQKGLGEKCRLIQGDFQKIGDLFEPETFDAAYQIEATCHSPNRIEVFSGIHKCLKKGGVFVGYEWVVLPAYDPQNQEHVRVKEGIEVGNGLPTLVTGEEIKTALTKSGFVVEEAYDANSGVHSEYEIPWYDTLLGTYSLKGFRMTRLGRLCTHFLVTTLEALKVAPTGTVRVSSLLNATALDLVEGGQKELFTPSFFFIARKV